MKSTDSDSPAAVLAGPDRSGRIADAVLEALEEAIAQRHSVSVFYTSLSDGQSRWRGIDPWVIFHRSEAWYLAGRCHVHDEPRTFRMDRISSVLPIGQSFVRPAEFNVDEWLSASWGLLECEGSEEAVILFDPSIAPLIEHAQHHASESKRRLDDGGLEFRVHIGHLDELARWIIGFGGAARAVEPAALIERVPQISAGALEAHEQQRKPARRSAGRPARERRTAS